MIITVDGIGKTGENRHQGSSIPKRVRSNNSTLLLHKELYPIIVVDFNILAELRPTSATTFFQNNL